MNDKYLISIVHHKCHNGHLYSHNEYSPNNCSHTRYTNEYSVGKCLEALLSKDNDLINSYIEQNYRCNVNKLLTLPKVDKDSAYSVGKDGVKRLTDYPQIIITEEGKYINELGIMNYVIEKDEITFYPSSKEITLPYEIDMEFVLEEQIKTLNELRDKIVEFNNTLDDNSPIKFKEEYPYGIVNSVCNESYYAYPTLTVGEFLCGLISTSILTYAKQKGWDFVKLLTDVCHISVNQFDAIEKLIPLYDRFTEKELFVKELEKLTKEEYLISQFIGLMFVSTILFDDLDNRFERIREILNDTK